MQFNYASEIILENERAKIEPLKNTHFKLLLPIALQYPDLIKYSPSKFGTGASLKDYFKDALLAKEQKKRFPFVIFDKQQNNYAGSTSYMNISNMHQSLEIGSTWIGKNFHKTGLNRHCKFLLLQHAFENLKCKRVELKTDARNTQSRRSIEGLGATFEGTLRSHMLMSDGIRRDSVLYSILATEWSTIKTSILNK